MERKLRTMAKKCATTKYRKRRQRERLNAIARDKHIKVMEAKHWTEVKERQRRAELARLADPRRLLVQRLVNILYARLSSNPLYQMMEISKFFGIDGEMILDAAVRGDDSVPLPPGYVWLKEGSPGSGRYA